MLPAEVSVAGVDGCRVGWLVALRLLRDPTSTRLQICRTFADVLALPEAPIMIAIDIPIGLPATVGTGGRPADIEARANLGARHSAVFAVPARPAVLETDYRRACAVALQHSDPPRKISKQAFFLFPKIREVDALMTPALQDRVVECHPELAFWALNGERPLELPKKIRSRPNEPGLALRRDLLVAAGYDRRTLEGRTFRASEAGPDDMLDAIAASWSAARIANMAGRRFPARPPFDERGLRMEIWS